MRATNCLALVAATLALGCRPPPPERTLSVNLTAEHFEGTNGVHVYTIPDRSAEFVGFHVRYAAGSTDDPPGKEGLAHLVEHLMFSRTLTLAGRELTIGTRLDEIAISNNAYTRFDHTHYWAIAPRRHLEELFALETVRITGGCSAISQADFEREREVVRNEIRQRSAGDFGTIYPALLEAVYGEHPYGRPVGGTDRSLRAITRDDVCRFIAAHYAPSKVRFYVVGDVDPMFVRRAATKWLGRIPPRESPPPPAIPRLQTRPALHELTLDVEAPRLLFAWRVPIEHQAYPLIDRVVDALEARMGFFATTYELGGEVDVSVLGGARAPIIVLTTTLRDPRKLEETIDAAEKAAASVDFQLPKEDFSRRKVDMFDARSWASAALLASFETLRGRGVAFADLGDRSGGSRFLVEEIAAIDRVEAGPLRAMGSNMLDPDDAVRIVVRPSGTLRRRGGAAGLTINHENDRWRVPADPAEASRPLALPAARRSIEIEDYRLDNGLRVILAQAGDLPLVRARFLYSVGQIHEPDELPGLGAFAAGFMGRGIDEDFTREHVRSLNTRIDYQIATFADNWGGGFDQRIIEKLRNQVAPLLRDPSDASLRELTIAMRSRLYGAEHPYTRHAAIDPDRLGAMNQSDLRGLIRRYYGARNATLIVAGRFDAGLMKEYVERRFAHLAERKRAEPAPPALGPVDGPLVVTATHAGATQLGLRIAFPTPRGIDARHPARLILASIIGGRLRSLREERGVTYGAQATVVPRRGPGQYAITLQVDPSRAAEAVTAVREVLAELRASPGSEALAVDFVAARRQVARALLLERSEPDQVIEHLDFAAGFGLPLEYSRSLAEKVARVGVEQVAELIREELAPARQVLGLHGTDAAVAAARAAAEAKLVPRTDPPAEPEPQSATEQPAAPRAPDPEVP